MARAKINNTTEDLIQDSGAVLWSFVKGEQLEYPVSLDFIQSTTLDYIYEAAIVEALNIPDQLDPPTAVKPSGVQTTLTVRVPVYRGVWDEAQAYNTEDVVFYNGVYYRKGREATEAVISPTLPPNSPNWSVTSINRVYIQFPRTLGETWEISPTVTSSVYGFFELRVTEPNSFSFPRTWKPIRGMVELLFSPTAIVPDV